MACPMASKARQPGLRRDAGAPRHRAHHGARRRARLARRAAVAVSRAAQPRDRLMESRWSDANARAYVAQYRERRRGSGAARLYLAAARARAVRSCCTAAAILRSRRGSRDLLGDKIDVLCVKGSGWDMADIEPAGLPAVRLDPLRRLEKLDRLSDEDMVNYLRGNLLDAAAPNPSVETLLHAFLPHKFVDHTHADAVLALTDRPDGEKICARGLRRPPRPRAVCHARFRARQAVRRNLRDEPRCRRAGAAEARASSPSARRRARPMSA